MAGYLSFKIHNNKIQDSLHYIFGNLYFPCLEFLREGKSWSDLPYPTDVSDPEPLSEEIKGRKIKK